MMSKNLFGKLGFIGASLALVLFCSVATAQQATGEDPGVRIKKLSKLGRMTLETPEYSASGSNAVRNRREWRRILVTYDSAAEWIDDMSISYTLICKGTLDGRPSFSLYTLNVRHADVEKGREHLAAAYLRPAAIKRYGEPYAVAVEISSGCKVVASMTEKPSSFPEEWWKDPNVVDNDAVIKRDGYLINRKDSPFYLINFDDYEEIK